MAVNIGDRMPDGIVMKLTSDGLAKLSASDLFKGKRVVLFAVPGAFTPGCSRVHLPGFVERADEIKRKGIDTIACLAVNDAFVMDAWAKDQKVGDKILMLADGDAAYTKKLGLEMDGAAAGLGTRSKRYSMLIEDGVVKRLNIEAAPGEIRTSSADAMLAEL